MPSSSATQTEPAARTRRRPSIMIVEDDDDVRLALADLLGQEGFDVVAVENGAEALERGSRGEPPDVILLDLMMPVLNGWKFLDARRTTELRDVPVIIITAGRFDPKAFDALPILRKPFDVGELLVTVRKAIAQRRAR